MNAIFLPGDGVFHVVRWAVWRLYEAIEQDVFFLESWAGSVQCPAEIMAPFRFREKSFSIFRQKKRPKPKFWPFVSAFPAFLGRPGIVLPLKTVRWTVSAEKKPKIWVICVEEKAQACA